MVYLQSRMLCLVRSCNSLVLVWCYLAFFLTSWVMEKGMCRFSLKMTPQLGRARSSLAERVRLSDDLHQQGKWCEKDNLWFGKTWRIGICESKPSREARVHFTGDFYESAWQTFVKWHRCIWCCCCFKALVGEGLQMFVGWDEYFVHFSNGTLTFLWGAHTWWKIPWPSTNSSLEQFGGSFAARPRAVLSWAAILVEATQVWTF